MPGLWLVTQTTTGAGSIRSPVGWFCGPLGIARPRAGRRGAVDGVVPRVSRPQSATISGLPGLTGYDGSFPPPATVQRLFQLTSSSKSLRADRPGQW